MRLAWTLALALSAAAFTAMLLVPALRYTVVRLSKQEKGESAAPARKVTVKKPEPTEQQVKEIARRVEKKKKERLADEVRALEKAQAELERLEEDRLKGLGLEKKDLFRALLEAAGLKATEVFTACQPPMPEAHVLREPAGRVQQLGQALATHFTSPQDPHGVASVRSLVALNHHLGTLIEGIGSGQYVDRMRVQKAKTAVGELDDLLQRLVRTWPTPPDWKAEPPPDPEVGPSLSALHALTPEESVDMTNLVEQLESLAPVEALSDAGLETMTPAELYVNAQQLDQALQDTFANTRAAELASVQGQPFAEALGNTVVYPVQTPDLANALQSSQPGSRPDFQAYNNALDQAQQAVQAMRLGAETMVGQAQEFAGGGGSQSQESKQAAQLRSAIQRATTTPSGEGHYTIVDLTAMMGQAYRGLGMASAGGFGGPSTGNRIQQGGAGTGMSTTSSEAGKAPASMRLDGTRITAQLLPGRKLSRTSKRQGWLYLDTWYVIGPFQRLDEFSHELNFKFRYPPETRVDLDATYPGKLSPATRRPAELRWRFYQSNTLRITPPDEIDGSVYYAYTEVHADEEQEVLIAVASDDAAKVWVNDLVVWQDIGLSAWRLDEGFRRILFRKGYNRILVRVENGPVICSYSILLCPVDLSTNNGS